MSLEGPVSCVVSEPDAAAGGAVNTPESFYRFRRASAVLDEFHELQRSTIYFAPPDELNDPMEGYKDLFWRGDAVVWRSLLRHYILVVMLMAYLHAAGEPGNTAVLRNLVLNTPGTLPDAPVRQIYAVICARSFATPGVGAIIEKLAQCTKPIRRDALAHLLRGLNPVVLGAVLNNPSLPQKVPNLAEFDPSDILNKLLRTIGASDELWDDQLAAADQLLAHMESVVIRHQLGIEMNCDPVGPPSPLYLLPSFAGEYVRALDELTYFPNYVASFSGNATNASMWGSYGDEHRGVCLKFRPGKDSLGRPSLELNAIRGATGTAGGSVEALYGWAPHSFKKMVYGDAYPEIDFFRSIGRLPVPEINGFWFLSEDGEVSPIRDEIRTREETWREGYWAQIEETTSRKTADWSHEDEYRLELRSSIGSYQEKPSRVLQYRFDSLAGIVFGANTSEADKVRMVRIVTDKCKTEKRKDFEFYQMRYSRRERAFRLVRLPMTP
jgi:hypothetical protein